MPLKIVVCAKQVPDTARITGDAMKEDGTVNRAALPAIFNPEDLNALEEALGIRDRVGGTVTVVTMGPPAACELLRESLFRGADGVVMVTDRRAAASDTLATSYILAQAVRKLGADLVLCGRQAIDGDTAQVGPQIAEKLGYTLVPYVEQLDQIDEKSLRARRNIGNGRQTVSCDLPAVLTVLDANEPRPRAAKRIMKYKKARSAAEIAAAVKAEQQDAAPEQLDAAVSACADDLRTKGLLIDQWDLDDIDADLAWCGRDGSPTKVHRIQSVVLAGGEYHEFPPTQQGCDDLMGKLIEEHTIG